MKKKLAVFALIFSSLLSSNYLLFASPNIDKNKKRIDQIQQEVKKNEKKISTNTEKIKSAKRSEAEIAKEIKKLNDLINKLQSEYNVLEAKYIKLLKSIKQSDEQIKKNIAEITQSEKVITDTKEDYSKRVITWDKVKKTRKVYKNVTYIDGAEKSRRKHDIKIILDKQDESIKKMEIYKKDVEISKQKEEISKSINEKEAEKVNKTRLELESKKKELSVAKAQKDKAVKELKATQSKLNTENTKIKKTNATLIAERKKLEQQIQSIIAAAAKKPTKPDQKPINIVKGTGQLARPISGAIVVGFGQEKVPGLKSNGIEIKGTLGQVIKSSDTGTVIYSGALKNLGSVVIIDHGGIITVYGNLATVRVSKGTNVKKGQAIGTLGRDSTSREPRLYFETRKGVNIVNPMSYL